MSRAAELIIAAVGVAMFVGTLVVIPWAVRRMPVDYFVRPPPSHPLPWRIARNIVGLTLVAAGVAMLVLPGQGIVTIVIGLSIMDLPIKHRVLRWLLLRPRIQRGVQRLRAKVGEPPLLVPSAA